MDAEEAVRRKRQADEYRRAADRKAGERDEVLRALKDDLGCSSLEEAERLLAEVEKEREAADAEAGRLGREWDKKWGDRL